MVGRFDPVRDTLISPRQKYGVLQDDGTGPSQSRPAYDDEFDHRDRRPSRSASIADILNPMPALHSPTLPEPSLPETARIPYQPRKRVSAASTIRTPVTPQQVDEMRLQHRNLLRTKWEQRHPDQSDGWNIIVSDFTSQLNQSSEVVQANGAAMEKKRKREVEEAEENNARLVANHYNSRQDQGIHARQQSPILPLRNFNNWIKSVIIGKYARRNGRVLDLGGGKGGDLQKWDRARIAEYIMCDIAEVSVAQARNRYNERKANFQAEFFACDCFATPLRESIDAHVLAPLFDNVSLQFCLHYGWESVPKAQLMLENISRYLKPGGVFVGTIPNADLLRSKLTAAMESSPSSSSSDNLKFGNDYYSVQFEEISNGKTKFPPFGHKYSFSLLDAVDDVAEYVVDWDQFISMAQQNSLECIYKKTFEEIWREEGQDVSSPYKDLAKRMKIFANGSSAIPMNAELWEATGEIKS